MRKLKVENAPEVDVKKAVAELKARKRILEAKVRNVIMSCMLHGDCVKDEMCRFNVKYFFLSKCNMYKQL